MTTVQKIIKYLATTFAIFLIVTIISAILSGIYGLVNALGLRNNKAIGEMKAIDFENSEVATLDIDVTFTNLIIKNGDSLKAETNNSNINCNQNYQNLQIKEKSHNWFGNNNEGDLTVYIPKNIEFETIRIKAGAGKINIEELKAKELSLNLGAGETEIKNLDVTQNCNIDGGVGKLSILSGTISNLKLDIGIGETNLTAMLNGKNDIDAGIGKLNIFLLGDKESYEIKTNKGLGSVKIDGEEMKDSQVWGNGKNYIEIDGAVGDNKIDF